MKMDDKRYFFLVLAITFIILSYPAHAAEIDYADIASYESLDIKVKISGEVNFDKFWFLI